MPFRMAQVKCLVRKPSASPRSDKAAPSGKAAPSARRSLLLAPSRSVLLLLSGLVEEAARERGSFAFGAERES